MLFRIYLFLIVLHCYSVCAQCDDGGNNNPCGNDCSDDDCGDDCGDDCCDECCDDCDDEWHHDCDKHENEVFNSCGPACQPYCDNRSPICTGECVAGCFCAPGYIRKEKGGRCIKLQDCKSCNGDPHSRPGCGNPCGHTCADVGKPPHGCPLFCLPDGCDCIGGYVLDTNIKKCVKPRDCTPRCPVNETYSLHPVICPPNRCDAIGVAFPCPANLTSNPACVCKEGYYRNKENKCVLKGDCDSCRGDSNARPGCVCVGLGCSDACSKESCYCISGYVEDPHSRKCVKHPPTCKENEIFNSCGSACQPYCDNRSPICTEECVAGCFCAPGYIRKDKNGPCIKLQDCKSCNGDPHSRPGCGNPCGYTCADVGKPPHPCPLFCLANGCDCINGYVLDTNIKKCVKPRDCTPRCPVNETYSLHPVICPPDTCDAIGEIFFCPANLTSNTPACVCKEGYYRNKDKDCVLKKDCDSCGGDSNARPGCGNPCDSTCEHLANFGPPKGPHSCPGFCLDNGCDCVEGYVVDKNIKKCVKPCDCTPTCKENEVFNSCGSACQPYCDNRSPICTEECVAGCFCAPGYIRKEKNGACIKLQDCESCNGDPHSRPGCGNPCGHTCADVGKPPHPCPLFCLANGCDCINGFVLDTNIKKCVKPCECTS